KNERNVVQLEKERCKRPTATGQPKMRSVRSIAEEIIRKQQAKMSIFDWQYWALHVHHIINRFLH
ncbi:unnamed protein product, partial [Mesorhabditis spiculigera]